MKRLLLFPLLLAIILMAVQADDSFDRIMRALPAEEAITQAREIATWLVNDRVMSILDDAKHKARNGFFLKPTDIWYDSYHPTFKDGDSYRNILESFNSEMEFIRYMRKQVIKNDLPKLLGLLQ